MQRQKFPERHTGLGFPRRVFDADSSSTHGFFPFSTVSFKVDTGFIHSFIHSSRQERLDADGENKKATRRRTVTSLHGDLPQIARDAAIASLRAGDGSGELLRASKSGRRAMVALARVEKQLNLDASKEHTEDWAWLTNRLAALSAAVQGREEELAGERRAAAKAEKARAEAEGQRELS